MLVLIFSTQTLHAAQLKTLSLDFKRELTENNKTEHISGTLHYDVKELYIVVEIVEPIKQIMVVKDNTLEIYYPIEKQAFRFISEGQIPLPLVESIIQATQAEYGLTKLLGYTLDKHDLVDEILYTYWNPPEKAKDKLGQIILGIHNDRLVSAEVKNLEGNLVARTLYQNHKKIGANFIPMKVLSSTFSAKSEVLEHQQIEYSNPKINTQPEILNFKIPASITVKEMKW